MECRVSSCDRKRQNVGAEIAWKFMKICSYQCYFLRFSDGFGEDFKLCIASVSCFKAGNLTYLTLKIDINSQSHVHGQWKPAWGFTVIRMTVNGLEGVENKLFSIPLYREMFFYSWYSCFTVYSTTAYNFKIFCLSLTKRPLFYKNTV